MNVTRGIIDIITLQAVRQHLGLHALRLLGDDFIVKIQYSHAVRRQAVYQLELGGGDSFDIFEGFQMLRPNGGDDGNLRLHDVAQLFDVTFLPGAHLSHKNLMNGL